MNADFPMNANDRGQCIIRAIVELGNNLGLRVVAEGVEGRQTLESLIGLGCEHAQGFFFTQPLPGREFETCYRASEETPRGENGDRQRILDAPANFLPRLRMMYGV